MAGAENFFSHFCFKIERPNIRCRRAAVARAIPRHAVPAVDHSFSIGRPARVTHGGVVLAEQFRAVGGHVHRVQAIAGPIAAGSEANATAVGIPTKRQLVAAVPRELARRAAEGGNHKNIPLPVTAAAKGNPVSIRRKYRVRIQLDMRSERHRSPARGVGKPDITAIYECQSFAIRA